MTLGRKKRAFGSLWPIRGMSCSLSEANDHRRFQPYIWCRVYDFQSDIHSQQTFSLWKNKPWHGNWKEAKYCWTFFCLQRVSYPPDLCQATTVFLHQGSWPAKTTFFSLLAFFTTQNPPSLLGSLDTLLGCSCDSTLSRKTEELSFLRCKDCVRPLAVCAGAEYTTE